MKSITRLNQIFSFTQKNVQKQQISEKSPNFIKFTTPKTFFFANGRSYTSAQRFSTQDEVERSLKGKKGVFFDANGVLYRRNANKIVTLQRYLISKGFDPSHFPGEQEVYDRLYDLKVKAGKGEVAKHYFYTELFLLHKVTDPLLLKEGVEEMMKSIKRIIVNEGVPRALSGLQSNGYKLGVITNSMSSRIEKLEWLRNVGIHTQWDGFVSSKDVGVKKPHPDIYLKCLEEAKVLPEEAVFVGHSRDELIGAKELGITTCMVNPDADAEADFNLRTDLSNILAYI